MILKTTLSLAAMLTLTAIPAFAEDKPTGKKHMLSVIFATPTPNYKTTIEEVRQVGKELWVKVTVVAPGGISPQVIGKTKAELAFEGPDLPVKYLIFGKGWGWKNEEPGLIFIHDLGTDKGKEKTKEYEGGTVLYPKK